MQNIDRPAYNSIPYKLFNMSKAKLISKRNFLTTHDLPGSLVNQTFFGQISPRNLNFTFKFRSHSIHGSTTTNLNTIYKIFQISNK